MTIDAEEAFAVLVDSCPSFHAGGGFAEYVASFEDEGVPDPYVRAEALAHHVVELVARRDVEEVGWLFTSIERLLAEGDTGAVDLVVLGFLEPLRNIVSHDDVSVGADELVTVMGPDAAEAWSENEGLWEDAARWVEGTPPVAAPDYLGVRHPELRRYLQAHRRRMAGGALIGAPDVVRYQRQRSGPAPGSRGRGVPLLVALVSAVVVLAMLASLLR